MIPDEAISQQTSGVIYFTTMGLLILVFLYLWRGVRKDYSDILPINRNFVPEWQKVFPRYDAKFEEEIETGEVIIINGKLSAGTQLLLKFIFGAMLIFIMFVAFVMVMRVSDRLNHNLVLLILINQSLIYLMRPISGLLTKSDGSKYYPALPKRQPYFDFKGELITADKVKAWKKEIKFWLPVVLVFNGAYFYMMVARM